MSTDAGSQFVQLWHWLKANDLPHWIAVLFTAILWPLVLFYWHRRKLNSIPHLEVRLVPGNITINGQPHQAVAIDFINHTGAVVYVSSARISNCSPQFSVPIEAARDIAENSYHLSFMNDKGGFLDREITLQTNTSAKTCIAVRMPPLEGFYVYHAPWYKRVLRIRKYFVLEYTAMVGSTRYFVATLY